MKISPDTPIRDMRMPFLRRKRNGVTRSRAATPRSLARSTRSLPLFDSAGERIGTIVAPSGRLVLRTNGATYYLRRE